MTDRLTPEHEAAIRERQAIMADAMPSVLPLRRNFDTEEDRFRAHRLFIAQANASADLADLLTELDALRAENAALKGASQ